MFCQLGLCTIELAGNMSQVSQNILLHATRVKFIDGGARKSDPDDCYDDNCQCFFFFVFQLRLHLSVMDNQFK